MKRVLGGRQQENGAYPTGAETFKKASYPPGSRMAQFTERNIILAIE